MLPECSQSVVCPRCRADLSGDVDVRCPTCGVVGRVVGDGLYSFCPPSPAAEPIMAWPDDFVRSLPDWAEGLSNHRPANATTLHELRTHGLMKDDCLTPFGETIRYHLDEYRWQKGRRGLDGVLELSALGATPTILDVGCGAGQTLRRLEPDRPTALFGVDRDDVSLALGSRLAKSEGLDLTLAGVEANSLPFRDASFDLVLTRVALNYMHQARALREMTRVVRPGGYVFCRVENVRHDLSLLRSARHPKAIVCRLRDFALGTVHALTGWQPTPGSTLRGGRAFASPGRLRRIFANLGCRVTHAEPSPNGPMLGGRRTQSIVVAQKPSAQ